MLHPPPAQVGNREADCQHLRRLLVTAREQAHTEHEQVSKLRAHLGATVRAQLREQDAHAQTRRQLRAALDKSSSVPRLVVAAAPAATSDTTTVSNGPDDGDEDRAAEAADGAFDPRSTIRSGALTAADFDDDSDDSGDEEIESYSQQQPTVDSAASIEPPPPLPPPPSGAFAPSEDFFADFDAPEAAAASVPDDADSGGGGGGGGGGGDDDDDDDDDMIYSQVVPGGQGVSSASMLSTAGRTSEISPHVSQASEIAEPPADLTSDEAPVMTLHEAPVAMQATQAATLGVPAMADLLGGDLLGDGPGSDVLGSTGAAPGLPGEVDLLGGLPAAPSSNGGDLAALLGGDSSLLPEAVSMREAGGEPTEASPPAADFPEGAKVVMGTISTSL